MRRWHRDPIINALAERVSRGELESQQDEIAASGMEAEGQDREDGPDAKHDSPTGEAGDAQ